MRWISSKSELVSLVFCVTTVALACGVAWKRDLIPSSLLWIAILALVLLGTNLGTFLMARDNAVAPTVIASASAEPAAAAPLLVPLDLYLDSGGDSPYATVQHKLRIVLRNVSTANLLLSPPSWRSEPEDLAVQSRPTRYWELEGTQGWAKGAWTGKESENVFVRPGQAVCTWIALEASASADEVRRRQIARRLGTLIFRATADGKSSEHMLRL